MNPAGPQTGDAGPQAGDAGLRAGDAGAGPDRGVRHRTRPGLAVGVLGTMAALGVLLGVAAGPAGAHDALESTVPADDAVLPSPPSEVVLTFGADQLAMGTAVTVTGPDGDDHAEGAPRVAGDVVTQAVTLEAPAGDYTVQWRSVSGDGHPTSGEFGFFVLAEDPTEGGADGGGAASAAPDADTEPLPDAGVDPGTAGQGDATVGPDTTVGPDATAGDESLADDAVGEPSDAPDEQAAAGTGRWLMLGAALVTALAVAGMAVARRRRGAPR